jgi:long-subunit fatty acid transport protein
MVVARRWTGRGLLATGTFFAFQTLTSVAQADGGLYAGVKGARADGRAGAFVAKADDIAAVGINPAGLANIGTTLIQLGNRFSYNQHTFLRNPTLDWSHQGEPPYTEFAKVSNGAPWQVLDPLLGVATNFGLKDWGFAAAVYSPAGVAREVYPDDGGQRYMMLRRNAQMINWSLSAAWKFKELFGLGVSVQAIAVPTLDYSLIIEGNPVKRAATNPVASSTDIRTGVKGSDFFTLNAIVGGWLRAAPFLEFGASAQVIPSSIQTTSNISVAAVNGKDPVTLTRDGKPATDVSLTLPLPLTARLGVRYIQLKEGKELFDIELDGVYETWSRVDTFRLNANHLVGLYRGQTVPFDVVDIQKQWQNTIGVRLGGDVRIIDLFTARGGVYYETATAKPEYSNVDFAGGQHLGFALGGSVHISKLELAFAYEYRVQPTVRVSDADSKVYQQTPGNPCTAPYTNTVNCSPQYPGRPAPPVNGGEYFAYSHVMALDGIYRF